MDCILSSSLFPTARSKAAAMPLGVASLVCEISVDIEELLPTEFVAKQMGRRIGNTFQLPYRIVRVSWEDQMCSICRQCEIPTSNCWNYCDVP